MDGMIEDLVGDSILRREKRSGDVGVNSGVEAPLKQQQDREQQQQHGQGQQQEQRQGMGDGDVGLTVMLPDAPLAEPPSRRGGAGVAKAGAPGGTQEVSTNTTPTLLAKAPPGALNKSFAALTHEDGDGVQPGARPGTREPVAPAADEAFRASAAADHLSEHGSAGEPATKVGSVPIKGAQRERAFQGQHRRQSSFSGFPTGATPPENPTPHVSSGSEQKQDLGEKHVLAMVGLPARGKSYMAQKLSHYLSFFHGAVVKVSVARGWHECLARHSARALSRALRACVPRVLTPLGRWPGLQSRRLSAQTVRPRGAGELLQPGQPRRRCETC